MDPSDITNKHIIISILCVVFITISVINALEFIFKKELKNSIYDNPNIMESFFNLAQYVCMIFATIAACIYPIMYIMTVLGYYTPIIDIVVNSGG